MKKVVLLCCYVIFFSVLSFASSGKIKNSIPPKLFAPSACSTQSATVTDATTGQVLYSATCTRCDDDLLIARISALLCAHNAVRRMMAQQ